MRKRIRKRGWFSRRSSRPQGTYSQYYSTPKRHSSLGIAKQFKNISPEAKKAIGSICMLALGAVMLLSLFHLAGRAGEALQYYIKLFFGFGRWYVPIIFITVSFFLMSPSKKGISRVVFLGGMFLILSFNGFVHLIKYRETIVDAARLGLGGGLFGLMLSYPLSRAFGFYASAIILFAFFLISVFLFFNTSHAAFFSKLKSFFSLFALFNKQKFKMKGESKEENQPQEEVEVEFQSKNIPVDYEDDKSKEEDEEAQTQWPETHEAPEEKIKKHFPKIDIPIDLLDGTSHKPKSGDVEANCEIIQKTLSNFNIPVEMGEVNIGPTVTQFTIKPSEGIKLSKIVSLNDNLALALAAHPIRIEAPIPGKSLVGIEVPNKISAVVTLRSMLESSEFQARKSSLSIAIGKDVKGTPWFGEIHKMPHMLIAGSTGSGKSVCINSIIMSLFFQNSPEDLRFIFVDPKRVELPIYNGIPHLLTPVITDTKKTINALRWCIHEMERRFDKLSEFHKRDIATYNREMEEKLPYIVFIIDELADLMAVAGPEIEGLIIRLAQMARAVGIHLVLATQRPSVDVITGLIKANITTRIAFSVASAVDSRTILDTSGAEKLLGRGDMLYTSAELSKPKRLQGALTSDQDIKRVTDFLKKQGEPEYLNEVVEKSSELGGIHIGQMSDDDSDSLLPESKRVIMQAGKASASLLQRRLKIGYARAARILDLLERQGVIGPSDGAKPREILISHSAQESSQIEENEVEDDEK